MGFFGFKSSKEVEEEKRKAAAEAAAQVERNNLTNLSNLSSGSQFSFAIPYFDVFDPRFTDYGVPVAVRGTIAYAIEDMDAFHSLNRREAYSDETFQNKLRGSVTKYVKGVVANAPQDAQIPVVQLERKILEISSLVESMVVPQIEKLFGIKVRSLDIAHITIDKESRGYRELRVLTADLEKERVMSKHNADISNFNKQNELNMDMMSRQHELNLGGQEEMQRMQMEHQRETMRIQREEMQRASRLQTEQTFLGAHQANLNAGVLNNATDNGLNAFAPRQGLSATPGMGCLSATPGMPSMPGMPGASGMAQPKSNVSYMVGVNGQQAGPFNWDQLQQLVQQGQLNAQSYVWTQGMANWAFAGQVAELQPLFASAMPPMPGM